MRSLSMVELASPNCARRKFTSSTSDMNISQPPDLAAIRTLPGAITPKPWCHWSVSASRHREGSDRKHAGSLDAVARLHEQPLDVGRNRLRLQTVDDVGHVGGAALDFRGPLVDGILRHRHRCPPSVRQVGIHITADHRAAAGSRPALPATGPPRWR